MADEDDEAVLEPFEMGDFDKYDPKFAISLSMETKIRKLRQSVENWKEIVLAIKHILLWDKQWHPTAIVGATTVCFMLLWLFDPSILSLIATVGLIVTIADFCIPLVLASVVKKQGWNAANDKEFSQMCADLVLYKTKFELLWANYHRMRINNRKMYFVITVSFLMSLIWIGNTFNNLFLTYVLVTLLLLLPGMEHNGIMSKWNSNITIMINDLIVQAKSKVGQQKSE